MKRFAVFTLIVLAVVLWMAPPVAAQTTSHVLVKAHDPRAVFTVDGKEYTGAASFLWPTGSRHTLYFPVSDDGCQYNGPRTTRYCGITGWTVNNASTVNNPASITADPTITQYTSIGTAEHLVNLVLFDGPDAPGPACSSPGPAPTSVLRPGIVKINGVCYWNSFQNQWLAAGPVSLEAYPYAGFVFIGWLPGPSNGFIRQFELNGPTTLVARFSIAKRVNFRTNPSGLQVRVNRTDVRTERRDSCETDNLLLPGAPQGIKPLCTGEFDFLPGSTQLIGAPSPQVDRFGKTWIFKNFDNGLGDNSLLPIPVEVQPEMNIVAEFVPGISTSFATEPKGLKLRVNERDNWPQLNFVFAPGTKQFVAAPMEQTYAGRKYVFRRWRHGGEATQEITIPSEVPETGLLYVAEYDILSQLVVNSHPAGGVVEVDGTSCPTPCKIDRPDQTSVRLRAPNMTQVSEFHRLYFSAWSDGGEREHALTVQGTDPSQVTMNFQAAYKLNLAADPSEAVDFTIDPAPSPDEYYPENAFLIITATAREGYRFRRWDLDLEGTSRSATLHMTKPRTAIARFDKIPHIQKTGIRNAAGQTPDGVVAPGSLISIFGAELAPYFEAGPSGPILAQAIAGVSVTAGNRILPLLFVSPGQINAQLPRDLPPGDYDLTVLRTGQPPISGKFTVVPAAPGLFNKSLDDRPHVVAFHEDGVEVTPQNPARRGERITLLTTGLGPYELTHPDGFVLPPAPAFKTVHDVTVEISTLLPAVEWAGGAPGQVGIEIVRFTIPEELATENGHAALKIWAAGHASNSVVLPVE
jgi:uncharacterized protein (TIGR03437 family)